MGSQTGCWRHSYAEDLLAAVQQKVEQRSRPELLPQHRRKMLLNILTLSIILVAPCAVAQNAAPNGRAEAEYVALHADFVDSDTLQAKADSVNTIARMLRDIREQFPQVRTLGIPQPWLEQTSLIIGLQPSVQPNLDLLCAAVEDYQSVHSDNLRLAEVDRLARQFGGSYKVTCRSQRSSLGPYAVLNFPRLLHVPLLIQRFQAVASVRSAENNLMMLGGVTSLARVVLIIG